MSLAGTWKRVKVDNGMAFGKAIGATEAQLASSANAVSTVTYTITGNNVKVERCHKYDGKELVSWILIQMIPVDLSWPQLKKTVNETAIGTEGEFDTMGYKIKAKLTGSADALEIAATSGWATASAKVVGGQLVESITHAESGTTVTSYWDKC